MIEYIDRAIRFVAARQRDDLDVDLLFEMALVRALEVLGEAATRVDQSTRDLEPRIPWRGIVGMRNVLIHGYDGVDHDIIWRVVTEELENVRPLLVVLAAKLGETPPD